LFHDGKGIFQGICAFLFPYSPAGPGRDTALYLLIPEWNASNNMAGITILGKQGRRN
jgi:hypothetical protein